MFLYKLKFKTLLCFTRERSSCDRVQQSYIIFFSKLPKQIKDNSSSWRYLVSFYTDSDAVILMLVAKIIEYKSLNLRCQ